MNDQEENNMTWKKLQRLLACLLAVLLLSQVGAFSPAVFAADASGYTLQDGTAIIPEGASEEKVNQILTRTLVAGFDEMSKEDQNTLLSTCKWEYYCKSKASFVHKAKDAWGSVGGFKVKEKLSIYDFLALSDAKTECKAYSVRLTTATDKTVQFTKAAMLDSSITLKQGAIIALPYTDATTVDYDALRAAILQQVVSEDTTPALTTENTEIKYKFKFGLDTWVDLDGGKIAPAVSAKSYEIQISFKGFRPSAKAIGRIYTVGLPSIAMQCVGSVMTFFMNQILMAFSATAVAVFGVYFKLQSFVYMPVFGMNNGIVPIIAYNYGAGKPKRITDTLKLGVICSVAIMIIGVLLFQLIPVQLLGLFAPTDDMIRLGETALRIFSISFPLAGVSIVLSSGFQALGNGFYSMMVFIVRLIVPTLPFAWLFGIVGGVDCIWWSLPVSDLLGLIVAILLMRRIYKKVIAKMYDSSEGSSAQVQQA